MHELLLYGQVPASRHQLIVSALTGLTALQPQPLAERHLLYRPRRDPGVPLDRATTRKAADLGIPPIFYNDRFFVQAVGNLAVRPRPKRVSQTATVVPPGLDANQDLMNDGNVTMADREAQPNPSQDVSDETDFTDFDKFPWKIEFRELPAVPSKVDTATRRAMVDISIPEGASPIEMLQDLGYRFVSEHVLQGHRFTHGHIDLRLFRGYGIPTAPASDAGEPIANLSFEPRSLLGGRQPSLEQPAPLQPIDRSGTYLLQARLAVADDTSPEVMSAGLAEMGAVRETLRGFIDLELGDRLTMNTRIR